MNLARISTNGQITLPIEIRRALNLKSGDKIMFLQNKNGEIILENLNIDSIKKAQTPKTGS